MDVIQKLQSTTYVKIRGTSRSAILRRVDKGRPDYAIGQYNKYYMSGEITRSNYMRSLGYRFTARVDINNLCF